MAPADDKPSTPARAYFTRHTVIDEHGYAVGYIDVLVDASQVLFQQHSDPLWLFMSDTEGD